MELTRQDLIELCEWAVVPAYKWHNRDSYSAQVNIASIYEGLTAGLDYEITDTTDGTIWIKFTEVNKSKMKKARYLSIDDIDDYKYDDEMFYSDGIDFTSGNYKGGYIPTEKRLEEAEGDDWY